MLLDHVNDDDNDSNVRLDRSFLDPNQANSDGIARRLAKSSPLPKRHSRCSLCILYSTKLTLNCQGPR